MPLPGPIVPLFLSLALAGCTTTGGIPRAEVGRAGVVALFEEAVSLSQSAGKLWLVDRAAHVVASVRLDSVGDASEAEIKHYSGSGTQSGRLREPTDLDATNGLVIIVSEIDGRVTRFDRSFAHLGSTAVGGQPVAFSTVDERTLFYIDATTNALQRWTVERGGVQIDYSPGAAGRAPIDVDVTSREVFVADAFTGCLHVLDSFGSFKRIMACGGEGDLVSLDAEEELVVVARQASAFVLVDGYSPAGRLLWRSRIPRRENAELSGALIADDTLWLLYQDALIRVEDYR